MKNGERKNKPQKKNANSTNITIFANHKDKVVPLSFVCATVKTR